YMQPMKERRVELASRRERARKLKAGPAAGEMVLDGKLDDPLWSGAPGYELRPIVANNGASLKTTARFVWKDGALYVGIRCEEPAMAKVNREVTRDGDPNVWFS